MPTSFPPRGLATAVLGGLHAPPGLRDPAEGFDAALRASTSTPILAKAPSPRAAARLTVAQISAALKRAGRHNIAVKSRAIRAALCAEQLSQPPAVTAAYAATVRAGVAILTTLNAEIGGLSEQVAAHFGRHPDREIYLSQPGLGPVLAARVLAEFGDDPDRYPDARSRKNYAGTSPITRASGRKKIVLARYAGNTRLADALHRQASSALSGSSGARAYYDTVKARGAGHHAAPRQLSNRLVGIPHGCLKTHTPYNEATAWPQRVTETIAARHLSPWDVCQAF